MARMHQITSCIKTSLCHQDHLSCLTTKYKPTPPVPYSGQHNTVSTPSAEEGAPADYSVITNKYTPTIDSTIHVDNNPAYLYSTVDKRAPQVTETQDTSDGGMVYSDVVRKDCKKTTVKTTAQNGVIDDSQQQLAPDTSRCKKTSVKVTVE